MSLLPRSACVRRRGRQAGNPAKGLSVNGFVVDDPPGGVAGPGRADAGDCDGVVAGADGADDAEEEEEDEGRREGYATHRVCVFEVCV